MEFDDIKKTWKNSFKEEESLNKDQIEAKLNIKSKSNTALNKVKRNYKFELVTSGILTIFVLSWLQLNLTSDYKYLIIGFAFIFFGALIFFAGYNYNKVKNTVISSDQIKPALKETIRNIERYVNFNKSSFTKFILLPFAILFGMFLGLNVGANDKEIGEIIALLGNDTIMKIIIVFVVASIGMIPISQYFNKKMYKQHLDELKNCLEEFEKVEEENGHV